MEEDMEILQLQMNHGMFLIAKLLNENKHICSRSWGGAFAKVLALMYENEGHSHEKFEQEMLWMVDAYKYLWDKEEAIPSISEACEASSEAQDSSPEN